MAPANLLSAFGGREGVEDKNRSFSPHRHRLPRQTLQDLCLSTGGWSVSYILSGVSQHCRSAANYHFLGDALAAFLNVLELLRILDVWFAWFSDLQSQR